MLPRRRAMSLFEVTIVVFIMGLLAAISAPMFANSTRVAKLEAAARQLAAHVEYIRAVAINEGRTTTLVCQNQAYSCNNVDFPDRAGVQLQVSLQEYDPSIMIAADFDSRTDLSFDLEGTPRVASSPLSQGAIVISSGDEAFTIEVAAGTGAVIMHRGRVADVSEGFVSGLGGGAP